MLVLGGWIAAYVDLERRRRRPIRHRAAVPFDAWFAQYYGNCRNVDRDKAEATLVGIARALTVEPTQVRPEDTIDDVLLLPTRILPDDSQEQLEEQIGEALGQPVTFLASWKTVDDIIRAIAAV